ncbi:MAG: MerR family transcriptional regulator [Oscillospiraceae bacterium]|nr:MerR family transcriptional regulator [Oscillospiraceae bacterium]
MDPTELLSIHDFAEYTGMKQSILRHYDDIDLFSPIFRAENGYRYYAPTQIITLNMVSVLCDLRTVLREISELQRDRNPEAILEHLENQEEKFDLEMRRLQESYAISHMYRRLIRTGLSADEKAITECDMPEIPIYVGSETKFEKTTLFYKDFITFCQEARKKNINLSYPIGGGYHNMDLFFQAPAQPQFFFSMDPHGCRQKEAGHYLIGYTRGYYGEMGDLPDRLAAYAKEHNLIFNGPAYILYVLDEVSIKDPDQYLGQISVQVKKKSTRYS